MVGNEGSPLTGSIINQISGDKKSGTWSEKIKLKPNLKSGKYVLNIYPLMDALHNSSIVYLGCANQDLIYGIVASSDIPASPSPSVTRLAVPSPTSLHDQKNLELQISSLKSQVASLSGQIIDLKKYQVSFHKLTNQLHKICQLRPKPIGCS